MSELYMLGTITDRKYAKRFSTFYQEQGLIVSAATLGYGTAPSQILEYFGMEGTEKVVLFHFITSEKWPEVKRLLQTKIRIDLPAMGIAFLVPLSSIGGKKTLNYLTDGQEFVKGEETTLKETRYELLIAIANQGYTEPVMNAARAVHAAGGTVIHAKGTGAQQAEKFFGVSLVPEKEMIFIVARKEKKNDIMKSIMDNAGVGTKAGAIVFSVPVTDTAGMRLIEEPEA